MKKITEFLFRSSKQAKTINQKIKTPLEPSQTSNISTCGVHDENTYPNVKGLEFCRSCDQGMCYICSNEHADDFHTIDWGFDIFNRMEAPRNELNNQFNQGFKTTVDLDKLYCPCGNKIPGIRTSTFCAACGTATCSAECHDRFVQSEGKCLFIRNFVSNEQTSRI